MNRTKSWALWLAIGLNTMAVLCLVWLLAFPSLDRWPWWIPINAVLLGLNLFALAASWRNLRALKRRTAARP